MQQVKDMVECMYERTYQQGEYVIKQGEPGNHLFVLAGMNQVIELFHYNHTGYTVRKHVKHFTFMGQQFCPQFF